jgi:hypothetical protein
MGDNDLPIVAWPPLHLPSFQSSIKKIKKKKKKNETMSETMLG